MAEIHFVVAVDENNGIGYQGKLLYHLKEDLKHFQSLTSHSIVVYGRKTLETFPHQKPLANRTNWILTHQSDYHVEGCRIFHTVDEVLEALATVDEVVYVIGGESVYCAFLPYCAQIVCTRIHASKKADTYFEVPADFRCVWQSSLYQQGEITYTFETYKKMA